MALALAQYEDLFQLVSGYLYWRKNGLTNRVQCGLCPLMYRLRVVMPSERELYTLQIPCCLLAQQEVRVRWRFGFQTTTYQACVFGLTLLEGKREFHSPARARLGQDGSRTKHAMCKELDAVEERRWQSMRQEVAGCLQEVGQARKRRE